MMAIGTQAASDDVRSSMNAGARAFFHTQFPSLGATPQVCRLGLATRGDTALTVADIHHAVDHGINFLNWCGTPNAFPQAVAELGPRRAEVMICVQFEARTAAAARTELRHILHELHTDY